MWCRPSCNRGVNFATSGIQGHFSIMYENLNLSLPPPPPPPPASPSHFLSAVSTTPPPSLTSIESVGGGDYSSTASSHLFLAGKMRAEQKTVLMIDVDIAVSCS